MRRMRRHLTYANVMATIAAFIAISGGTAVALNGANTVFTDDIGNDEVRTGRRAQRLPDRRRPCPRRSKGWRGRHQRGGRDRFAHRRGHPQWLAGAGGTGERSGPRRATNSANQTIPDSTPTVISLDSEGFDAANLHESVTNNSRLTASDHGRLPGQRSSALGQTARRGSVSCGSRRTSACRKQSQSPRRSDTASATDDLIQDVSRISLFWLAGGLRGASALRNRNSHRDRVWTRLSRPARRSGNSRWPGSAQF